MAIKLWRDMSHGLCVLAATMYTLIALLSEGIYLYQPNHNENPPWYLDTYLSAHMFLGLGLPMNLLHGLGLPINEEEGWWAAWASKSPDPGACIRSNKASEAGSLTTLRARVVWDPKQFQEGDVEVHRALKISEYGQFPWMCCPFCGCPHNHQLFEVYWFLETPIWAYVA